MGLITKAMITKAVELAYNKYEEAKKEEAKAQKAREERTRQEKEERENLDYHKLYEQKLEKLSTLHNLGAISDEEFDSEKEEILHKLKKLYHYEKHGYDEGKIMLSAVTDFSKKTTQFALKKGQQIFSKQNRDCVAQVASNVLEKTAELIKPGNEVESLNPLYMEQKMKLVEDYRNGLINMEQFNEKCAMIKNIRPLSAEPSFSHADGLSGGRINSQPERPMQPQVSLQPDIPARSEIEMQQETQVQPQGTQNIQKTAEGINIKEKLEQLASLYQAGILTNEEFTTKKAELLARM